MDGRRGRRPGRPSVLPTHGDSSGRRTSTSRSRSRCLCGIMVRGTRSHSSRATARHCGSESRRRFSSGPAWTALCQPSARVNHDIPPAQLTRMSSVRGEIWGSVLMPCCCRPWAWSSIRGGGVGVVLVVEDADPGVGQAARTAQSRHAFDVGAHRPSARLVGDELHCATVAGNHVQQRRQLRVVGQPAGDRPLVPILIEAHRGGQSERPRREAFVEHPCHLADAPARWPAAPTTPGPSRKGATGCGRRSHWR